MGMNDINMGSEELFVSNYRRLCDEIHDVLPEAKLIVLSVTPIAASQTFSSNEKIDRYNNALRLGANEYGWYFIDTASPLKGSDNAMKPGYSSGDGIHISRSAYNVILYAICRNAGIFS